jgi:thimet oligopeptidase
MSRSATVVRHAAFLAIVALLASAVPTLAQKWKESPDGVREAVQTRLDASQKLLDEALAVSGPRTVQNTLEPLNRLSILLDEASSIASLMENTHPDSAVRSTAEKANQDVQAFYTALSLNRAAYDAILAADVTGADAVTRRVREHALRDYRRAGVDKDEATRERIRVLREELVKLGQEFERNIREDRRFVEVASAAELEGLPPDFIESHKPDQEGKIRISTDYPDYFPVMQYAKSPAVRQKLYVEFMNRAYPANREVLAKILAKRYELATTLGYVSWAAYIYEDKMAKDVATVTSFIDQLDKATAKRGRADFALLLAAKRRDDPKADRILDWERHYYSERVKAENYAFDSQVLRAYYNYPAVKQGILQLTETLFGVEIAAMPGAKVWHPSVEAYEMTDASGRLGRFYLDMHPREGKYGHAAQFPLVPGVAGVQAPEAVLVCNFPKPDDNGLALMDHDDVKTFLHEFGHLLHTLFGGHQRWVGQSGIATEWDFVEAPSQMLEEWAMDPKTLQTFARHHETQEPIPAELIEKLRVAEDFGNGLYVRQQNFYTAMSFQFHKGNPTGLDLDRRMVELQGQYSPYPYEAGTHMYASFGHLEGYSAMYYTYMWSLVIAKDMFSRFDPANLLDQKIATEYRAKVLAPGGTKDAADLVKDFLGRQYGFTSFENWMNKPWAN